MKETWMYFVPLGLVFLGLVCLAFYTVIVSLRQVTRQMVRVNEQLLLAVSVAKGSEDAGRALVAYNKTVSEKLPKKHLGGVSDKKTETVSGINLTVGGR